MSYTTLWQYTCNVHVHVPYNIWMNYWMIMYSLCIVYPQSFKGDEWMIYMWMYSVTLKMTKMQTAIMNIHEMNAEKHLPDLSSSRAALAALSRPVGSNPTHFFPTSPFSPPPSVSPPPPYMIKQSQFLGFVPARISCSSSLLGNIHKQVSVMSSWLKGDEGWHVTFGTWCECQEYSHRVYCQETDSSSVASVSTCHACH